MKKNQYAIQVQHTEMNGMNDDDLDGKNRQDATTTKKMYPSSLSGAIYLYPCVYVVHLLCNLPRCIHCFVYQSHNRNHHTMRMEE